MSLKDYFLLKKKNETLNITQLPVSIGNMSTQEIVFCKTFHDSLKKCSGFDSIYSICINVD